MAYTVVFDPYEFIITAFIQGTANVSELTEFIHEILTHVKENNCFFLLVSFEKAHFKISLSEFHDLTIAISAAVEAHGLKGKKFTNAVVGMQDQGLLHRYEMIARGGNNAIFLFNKFEDAKIWLQKSQSDYHSEKRWQ